MKLFTNKSHFVYFGIIIIVFIKAFSFIFDAKVDLNGDNLAYFIYAKSILQGGYTNLMSVANPPTNDFPPGYPLILASVMLFTKSIVALKIFNGILYLAGISLLFYTLRKVDKAASLVILAFSVTSLFNPDVLDFATMLMTEMSYLLCIALVAFFISRLKGADPIKDYNFWLIVFFTSYALYIRLAGVVILGAVIFYYLLNKNWKHIFLTIGGYIVLVAPWFIRDKVLGLSGTSKYTKTMGSSNAWDQNADRLDVSGMIHRFGTNFRDLVTKQVPDGLFAKKVDYAAASTMGEWVVGILLLTVIIYGLFHIKKLNFYFLGIILATGAVLLPWNGGGETRYITSIIPILYLGLFYGVYQLIMHFMKSEVVAKSAMAVLVVVIFVSVKPNLDYLHASAESKFHPAYENYFTIAKSVKANTPVNTNICCRKPTLFHFYSDRPVAKYIFTPDDKKLINHMYKSNFSYVVLEQLGYGSTPKYLYPAIKKNPEVFSLVLHLKNPDTYLFKFERKAAEELLGIVK